MVFNRWAGVPEDWPGLSTPRLELVLWSADHAPAFLAFLSRNAERLAPHSPVVGLPTVGELVEHAADVVREARTGLSVGLLAFPKDDPSVGPIATVALSPITYGPLQQAYLGYKIDGEYEGRGLMSEAVNAAIEFGFETVGLCRIQAAIVPGNARSEALVARVGFRKIGLARRYLELAGERRDHNLYELNEPDWRANERSRTSG